MQPTKSLENIPFNPAFFPQQILLLSVGDNMMPMGYWTAISKEPFRFLICMGVGNYSLTLIKKYREAALHFMDWDQREKVVASGYYSGRDINKSKKFGFELLPASKLKMTKLVAGAITTYETTVFQELLNTSREFCPFILDVVATHGLKSAGSRKPIYYLGNDDFSTTGETWHYNKTK
jgi:flavin reductase (DIM6/NTAB) family NADH-FMN oxidoreductase RutF